MSIEKEHKPAFLRILKEAKFSNLTEYARNCVRDGRLIGSNAQSAEGVPLPLGPAVAATSAPSAPNPETKKGENNETTVRDTTHPT